MNDANHYTTLPSLLTVTINYRNIKKVKCTNSKQKTTNRNQQLPSRCRTAIPTQGGKRGGEGRKREWEKMGGEEKREKREGSDWDTASAA